MSTKRPASTSLRQPIMTVEPAPLGMAEQRGMEEALADFAPLWTAELHGICAEDASLVVLPESGDDIVGPSFVVSRETLGYRLDQVHWDRLTEVGQYSSLMDVATVIQQRISRCVPMLLPLNTTLH